MNKKPTKANLEDKIADLEGDLADAQAFINNPLCPCGHSFSAHDWQAICSNYPACPCQQFTFTPQEYIPCPALP